MEVVRLLWTNRTESSQWKIRYGSIFLCWTKIFMVSHQKVTCKKKTNILYNKPIQPRQPLHMGGKILKIPLVSLVPKSVSLCQSCITSNLVKRFFFFNIPDLVNRPTAAVVASKNCHYMALQTSIRIWHHITTVSFMSAFIFVWIRKPSDIYEHA